jgi:hypothetical protein
MKISISRLKFRAVEQTDSGNDGFVSEGFVINGNNFRADYFIANAA